MLEKVKSVLAKVNEAAGVELNFLGDNKIEVFYVHLKRNKKLIRIIEKKEFLIESVNELSLLISKNIPIALTINGRNTLHRKITPNGEEEVAKIASNAFPSINTGDFYIQKCENDQALLLSLIRKEFVDNIVASLTVNEFNILSLSFGPFELDNYLTLIYTEQEELNLGNHQLTISDQRIVNYKVLPFSQQDEEIRIGDEKIEGRYLISYAAVLNHFAEIPSAVQLAISDVNTAKEEWIQKQLFVKSGWGLLVFFFILLMFNFFLFSEFNNKNTELLSSVNYNRANLDELKELEKQVKERKVFLEDAGWLSNSRSSFYADRIANTVPSEIDLLELNISPLDERMSKLEKKPVIINNRIVIKGTCNNPSVLNSWLGSLKDFKWIREIKGQNYLFDNSKRIGSFDFYIELTE